MIDFTWEYVFPTGFWLFRWWCFVCFDFTTPVSMFVGWIQSCASQIFDYNGPSWYAAVVAKSMNIAVFHVQYISLKSLPKTNRKKRIQSKKYQENWPKKLSSSWLQLKKSWFPKMKKHKTNSLLRVIPTMTFQNSLLTQLLSEAFVTALWPNQLSESFVSPGRSLCMSVCQTGYKHVSGPCEVNSKALNRFA